MIDRFAINIAYYIYVPIIWYLKTIAISDMTEYTYYKLPNAHLKPVIW